MVRRSQQECDGRLYTIQPGDTFYRISRRENVPLDELLEANPDVDPESLQVGQQICIPGEAPTPPPGECDGELYTIQSGDTFYRLSRRYNISLDELVAANPGVDPNALRVGQQICIPVGGPTPPPTECPGIQYTIEAGDTLYVLAQEYNTTVDEILRYNPGLDPNRLRIGQVICIPTEVEPTPMKRCVILPATDNTPEADAVALLDYTDNTVLVTLTDVPAPTELPDGEQYVMWLRTSDTVYVGVPMEATEAGVYVGLVELEGDLSDYQSILITAEGADVGDAPTGLGVAGGSILMS